MRQNECIWPNFTLTNAFDPKGAIAINLKENAKEKIFDLFAYFIFEKQKVLV